MFWLINSRKRAPGRKRCQVALNYIPAIIRIVVVCTIRGEMFKKKQTKKNPGRTSAIFRMLCCCVPVLFSVFVVSVIVKWLKQKKKTHRKGQKKNLDVPNSSRRFCSPVYASLM